MKFEKIICIILSACVISLAACNKGKGDSGETPSADYTSEDIALQTVAADDYGRAMLPAEKSERGTYVGLFYFLWSTQTANTVTVSEFEKEGRVEAVLTGEEVKYAPTFTWWGEPMYGYYHLDDPWVVRKHVELFMNAGIDFLCFDTTNNDYYLSAARTVLDVLKEYREAGFKVPKAMFMTNTSSDSMIRNIYNAFYKNGDYDGIWFTGNGNRPWILGTGLSELEQNIKDYFYIKPAQWPNANYNSSAFPWMSWKYPQERFEDQGQGFSIMNVSVSQHVGIGAGGGGVNFSLSGLMAPYNYPTLSEELKARVSEAQATRYYNGNWGRGYSHADNTNNLQRALQNVNFEEQWDSVTSSINLVFVTGWNEWVAQKQADEPVLGDTFGHYVDTFNMEFSRDIEMMKGGYLDNAYLQLARNVREFKMTGGQISRQPVGKNVNLENFAVWANIPAYLDLIYETDHRDAFGAGGVRYVNDTGRNDIDTVKVAEQGDYLYFLVTAVDNITERKASDKAFMNLWIGTGEDGGFAGLNFVLNRTANGNSASVERIKDGSFESCGKCEIKTEGNQMLFKVAKSALGIGGKVAIEFKVTDNLQAELDITDLYTNGDCAPLGRINYAYYGK